MALCPAPVESWLVFWGDLVLEGEAELLDPYHRQQTQRAMGATLTPWHSQCHSQTSSPQDTQPCWFMECC